MKEEDIGGFYGVYQEIKSQYAQFIQNIKQKPIIHNLKLDKNPSNGQYSELFSSYATDMLIANEFSKKYFSLLVNFAECDKQFSISHLKIRR